MSERDREFLDYYERTRVHDQIDYYDKKASWHRRRADGLTVAAGVLMLAAAVSSGVVASGSAVLWPLTGWHVLAALVPALSAAVAATRSLYEHDRNRDLFRNTYLELRALQANNAPSATLSEAEYRLALSKYVNDIEGLLSREHVRWFEMMKEVPHADVPDSGP